MKLVFATNNLNKLMEVQSIMPSSIELVSLEHIGCIEEIPETADTIEGNAVLKADYITQKFQLDCFADDTGLEVDFLNGNPGVFSARYAGEGKNNEDNIDKLLRELGDSQNRKAQFKTVIALNINVEQFLFTGICEGEITYSRRGTKGFGYDAVFQPAGSTKTFAEMNLEEKAVMSHRGIALKKLIKHLSK
ncbi:non-canonical purine NTP diphosphatase [soil metagenome]